MWTGWTKMDHIQKPIWTTPCDHKRIFSKKILFFMVMFIVLVHLVQIKKGKSKTFSMNKTRQKICMKRKVQKIWTGWTTFLLWSQKTHDKNKKDDTRP